MLGERKKLEFAQLVKNFLNPSLVPGSTLSMNIQRLLRHNLLPSKNSQDCFVLFLNAVTFKKRNLEIYVVKIYIHIFYS